MRKFIIQHDPEFYQTVEADDKSASLHLPDGRLVSKARDTGEGFAIDLGGRVIMLDYSEAENLWLLVRILNNCSLNEANRGRPDVYEMTDVCM